MQNKHNSKNTSSKYTSRFGTSGCHCANGFSQPRRMGNQCLVEWGRNARTILRTHARKDQSVLAGFVARTQDCPHNTSNSRTQGPNRIGGVCGHYARLPAQYFEPTHARTETYWYGLRHVRTNRTRLPTHARLPAQFFEPTHARTEVYWRGLRRARTTARTMLRTHAREDRNGK